MSLFCVITVDKKKQDGIHTAGLAMPKGVALLAAEQLLTAGHGRSPRCSGIIDCWTFHDIIDMSIASGFSLKHARVQHAGCTRSRTRLCFREHARVYARGRAHVQHASIHAGYPRPCLRACTTALHVCMHDSVNAF